MELLTVDDAATRIGVSRRTVYRWLADGTLVSVDVPGGVRIPAEQLDEVKPPARHRTPATSGDVRAHVLAAAASLLPRHGHTGLTMEQVAAAAQMSVGGVTYHFPTKGALIDGLVDAFLDQFEREWTALRSEGVDVADAYIEVSLAGPREQRVREILLAAIGRPTTMRRIDGRIRSWYREITGTSSDPDVDLRRCLAADAVWLFGLFGLQPVSDAAARRLGRRPR